MGKKKNEKGRHKDSRVAVSTVCSGLTFHLSHTVKNCCFVESFIALQYAVLQLPEHHDEVKNDFI